MLLDIFKNVGIKDKTKVDKQRARMRAAATERIKSDKVQKMGIWIEPDEARLVDNDMCTTEHVQITHPSHHLSYIENCKCAGQE